jgi:hypothetical protein
MSEFVWQPAGSFLLLRRPVRQFLGVIIAAIVLSVNTTTVVAVNFPR